jgi:hypothetical protein
MQRSENRGEDAGAWLFPIYRLTTTACPLRVLLQEFLYANFIASPQGAAIQGASIPAFRIASRCSQ